MARQTYAVTATQEGTCWSLVADVDHREVASQVRRLEKAEPLIREAIAMALDVDERAFDVDIAPASDS